jgi:hypothetical protein
VYGRFKRFKDWRGDLQDDPRSGRPSTSRNANRISNVREMSTRECLRAVRMMSAELNVNKEMVRQILHKDLWKKKICFKSFPHRLTDEQKQKRLTSYHGFIQSLQDNPNFFTAFPFLPSCKLLTKKGFSRC